MFSEPVKEELRKRHYYVTRNFNGEENLIDSLRSLDDPLSLQERVHRILSHPEYVAVISPWKPYLNLEDPYEPNVLYSQPYSVYTSEGRFLYRVKKHDGVFGNSILDKTIILQSLTGAMYYLQYQTTDSFKTILLLINNLALEPSMFTTDRSYLEAPEPPMIEPSEYYIILDASQILSSSGVSSVNIHFLSTDALFVKTGEEIINNQITQVEPHLLTQEDPTFMWFPKRSGWLCLTKGVESLSFLLIDDVLGTGDDRLIYSGNNAYYLAMGHEEDTNLIRQELGLISRRPPGFTLSNKVKLTGTLTYG